MRLHWYWPFVRVEELSMAHAVVNEGDTLTIEAVNRDAAPLAQSSGGVTVVRDLPDVNRAVGPLRWAPSRANTYRRRARVRAEHWRSDRYDLFHIHYLNRFTDSTAKLPAPLVMSVHDAVPHVPRIGSWAEHRLLKRLYARPEALVVHHQRVADELIGTFGVAPGRIHVVPYPVLTRSEHPEPPPAGPPVVLLFGALRENKGLEVLEQALEIIPHSDIRVVIAGRGQRELEQRALSMQERDHRVTAEIGFVSLERKAELFGLASVVALPYTSFSSQSAVLHDAYGYGRPVVVTDVGALGTTVVEDGTGLVVPPHDPAALAEAIDELLEPHVWARTASACATVSAERSPEAFGRGLRSVYKLVLG